MLVGRAFCGHKCGKCPCSSSPLVSRSACQPALRPPRRVPSASCSPMARSLSSLCPQMRRAHARRAPARSAHARKAHAPMAPSRLAPNRLARSRQALAPTKRVRKRPSIPACLTSPPPTVQCHPFAGVARSLTPHASGGCRSRRCPQRRLLMGVAAIAQGKWMGAQLRASTGLPVLIACANGHVRSRIPNARPTGMIVSPVIHMGNWRKTTTVTSIGFRANSCQESQNQSEVLNSAVSGLL